jgi:hypothetical protein
MDPALHSTCGALSSRIEDNGPILLGRGLIALRLYSIHTPHLKRLTISTLLTLDVDDWPLERGLV